MVDLVLILLIIGIVVLLGLTVHPLFWLVLLLLLVVVLLTRGSRSGTRL